MKREEDGSRNFELFLSFMGELKMREKSSDFVQAAVYHRIPQTGGLKK